MSGAQHDGKLDVRRTGGIASIVVGGVALAFATFFVKNPNELAEANSERLQQAQTDNSLLRERVGVLEQQLAERIEQRTVDRFTGTQAAYERQLTDMAIRYERELSDRADRYLLDRVTEVDEDVDELRRTMGK